MDGAHSLPGIHFAKGGSDSGALQLHPCVCVNDDAIVNIDLPEIFRIFQNETKTRTHSVSQHMKTENEGKLLIICPLEKLWILSSVLYPLVNLVISKHLLVLVPVVIHAVILGLTLRNTHDPRCSGISSTALVGPAQAARCRPSSTFSTLQRARGRQVCSVAPSLFVHQQYGM